MSNRGFEGFILGAESIKENIIIISGTSRAGKTLLSKVLATHENVEWIEEPYEILSSVIMCGCGLLDRDVFGMLFNSCVHELVVNNVLLRNGNFRPNDLSSVWNTKSGSEIFRRLHALGSRADVEGYIEDRKPYFILDIPEILPFTDLIRDLCDNLTVINVVRDPYDVADDCFRKGWFDTDYIDTACNDLFRTYDGIRIPWWVREGEEDEFLTCSVYEKGLIYWRNIQSWNRDENTDSTKYDIVVRYEDMVDNIDKVLDRISDRLSLKRSNLTDAVKSEIIRDYKTRLKERESVKNIADTTEFKSAMRRFGYGN